MAVQKEMRNMQIRHHEDADKHAVVALWGEVQADSAPHSDTDFHRISDL